MRRGPRLLVRGAIVLGASLVACNAVLNVDRFRLCAGDECAALDAATDVIGDSATEPDAADGGGLKCQSRRTLACDHDAGFGSVHPLGVDNGYSVQGGFISPDGCELYFSRWAQVGSSDYHPSNGRIFRATWDDTAKDFINPQLVGVSDPDLDASSSNDYGPTLSPDGLHLYFASYRNSTEGKYTSVRSTTNDSFLTASVDLDATGSADDSAYVVTRAGYWPETFSLFRTPLTDAGFGLPANVDPDGGLGINIPGKAVIFPAVTPDELHLYFAGFRDTNMFELAIWSSTWTSGNWATPTKLPAPINQNKDNSYTLPAYITPDDCTLYFSSQTSGFMETYWTTRGQ